MLIESRFKNILVPAGPACSEIVLSSLLSDGFQHGDLAGSAGFPP